MTRLISLLFILFPSTLMAKEWYAMSRYGECVTLEITNSRKQVVKDAKTPDEIEKSLQNAGINYSLKPMYEGVKGMLKLKVIDDRWGLILVEKQFCREFIKR